MPKLGSLRDRVFRRFQLEQDELELKRSELLKLVALTNPLLSPDQHLVWSKDVNKVWASYIERLLGIKLETPEDKAYAMSEFYENVVKDKPLSLTKAEDGTLIVS